VPGQFVFALEPHFGLALVALILFGAIYILFYPLFKWLEHRDREKIAERVAAAKAAREAVEQAEWDAAMQLWDRRTGSRRFSGLK
jgi:F0F1-type ATP synthase membrane subunit b/b'